MVDAAARGCRECMAVVFDQVAPRKAARDCTHDATITIWPRASVLKPVCGRRGERMMVDAAARGCGECMAVVFDRVAPERPRKIAHTMSQSQFGLVRPCRNPCVDDDESA